MVRCVQGMTAMVLQRGPDLYLMLHPTHMPSASTALILVRLVQVSLTVPMGLLDTHAFHRAFDNTQCR